MRSCTCASACRASTTSSRKDEELDMRRKLIFIAPLAILAMALFIAIGGWIVQLLWNWLLPALFGWRSITLGQALGILVLCRVLFGGLGVRPSPGSNVRRRIAERWDHMTPE